MSVAMFVEGDDVGTFFADVLPNKVRRLCREAVYEMVEDIARDIRIDPSFPHRRTGMLEDTLRAVRQPAYGDIAVASALWRGAFYWRFLEHGQGGGKRKLEFVQHTYDQYTANLGPLFRHYFGVRVEALRASQP